MEFKMDPFLSRKMIIKERSIYTNFYEFAFRVQAQV